MKQIIMDLADKAIEDMPKIRWEIPDEFCEKFAELIVAECAELNFRELGLSGSSSFDVSRMIKEHFGVEK